MSSSIPGPDTIQRYELGNGIIVLVHENHSSPSVALHGYLWAGALDEAEGFDGLSDFTAECLTHGAGKRSMAQIYAEVESIGAAIDVGSDRQLTGFGAKSLAEDTRFVLGILADVLRRPKFPLEEIERVRDELLTSLEIRDNDTRARADLAFDELAYAGHPYGRDPDGTVETIHRIERKHLKRFHKTFYTPRGMTFSFAGAVHGADAAAWVNETFGDWQAERPARVPLPPVTPLARTVTRHVSMPGKIQTDIVLGFHGPQRSSEDFLAARLANCILGVFGMMGRLGNNVRESLGLAYYSYSRIAGGLGPGPWAVMAGVNPANVERAVQAIRDELRRIITEPVPAEELADNQAYITGSMPLTLESNDSVARTILDMELHGLGTDYLQRYKDIIDGFTPADVQAVARRYLDPDCFALATAGPDGVGT